MNGSCIQWVLQGNDRTRCALFFIEVNERKPGHSYYLERFAKQILELIWKKIISVYLFIYLLAYVFLSLSVSLCLFVHPLLNQLISQLLNQLMYISQSIYLFVCSSVYLSI